MSNLCYSRKDCAFERASIGSGSPGAIGNSSLKFAALNPSSEHEGTMAETTAQRIQKLLRDKAKQKEADELERKLVEEQNNERQATAEHVRQKWEKDTYVIAEILKDFEEKMSALGLHLIFQDAGQKGDALA